MQSARFDELLRHSKLFSLPRRVTAFSADGRLPVHQIIETLPSSFERGEWGLKSQLPSSSMVKNRRVVLHSLDTPEGFASFAPAEKYYKARLRFEELKVPVLTNPLTLTLEEKDAKYKEKIRSYFDEKYKTMQRETELKPELQPEAELEQSDPADVQGSQSNERAVEEELATIRRNKAKWERLEALRLKKVEVAEGEEAEKLAALRDHIAPALDPSEHTLNLIKGTLPVSGKLAGEGRPKQVESKDDSYFMRRIAELTERENILLNGGTTSRLNENEPAIAEPRITDAKEPTIKPKNAFEDAAREREEKAPRLYLNALYYDPHPTERADGRSALGSGRTLINLPELSSSQVKALLREVARLREQFDDYLRRELDPRLSVHHSDNPQEYDMIREAVFRFLGISNRDTRRSIAEVAATGGLSYSLSGRMYRTLTELQFERNTQGRELEVSQGTSLVAVNGFVGVSSRFRRSDIMLTAASRFVIRDFIVNSATLNSSGGVHIRVMRSNAPSGYNGVEPTPAYLKSAALAWQSPEKKASETAAQAQSFDVEKASNEYSEVVKPAVNKNKGKSGKELYGTLLDMLDTM
ncbi:mitochondrial ribosomal protein subunit-domain-containing protein [Lipomyces orientalis]|uniref:Mitochondrial ribosomal protein subunit-domain-containing protein n=1 Tax=Lipomyces orientalis TaxID=1233043 RepID=A0ACC3TE13_9ASCO